MSTQRINPRELSSRKLWQLAESPSDAQISADELVAVIAELANRRQDLERLQAAMKAGKDQSG
ncbi:MAG: hypothetical protein HRT77_05900 [Halioglobus sp.]|nr:hypothetical protein [Halioglobus sp.]